VKEWQIKEQIEQSLGVVPFEPPITIEYCKKVRDDLRARCPAGCLLDVFHRNQRELVVEVRSDGVLCRVQLPLV
jgi:hypothetical protein